MKNRRDPAVVHPNDRERLTGPDAEEIARIEREGLEKLAQSVSRHINDRMSHDDFLDVMGVRVSK